MTDTPEMVIRVMVAIQNAMGDACSINHTPDGLMVARAAIAAIREPTDEMIQAAYDAVQRDDGWCIEDEDHWKKAWVAAVDAAIGNAGGANG